MMEGMAWREELMNWLMRGFHAGSTWSRLNSTTTSSAMVLLSEAVREAWKRGLRLLPPAWSRGGVKIACTSGIIQRGLKEEI